MCGVVSLLSNEPAIASGAACELREDDGLLREVRRSE
jgi:hypothetical protein